jgi:hypothetical protein
MLTNDNLISGTITCFKAGVFEAIDLLPKQIQALKALTDVQIDEILYGGAAGGGKTWLGCEWVLWNCLAYPGTRWAIGRHHLKQIRESTVVTFRKVCKKHGIPSEWWKYNEQSVHITFSNGSELIGVEMMHRPGDPEFDGFGSTEYTGAWIEEGGGVAAKAREVLGTRVGRHRNDEYGITGKLLVTGNPSRNWMYREFFKPAKEGKLPAQKKFIQSFAHENEKRESGYLERLEKLTGQTRQRLLLGNWEFEDDPDQLIESTAISDIYESIQVQRDANRKCIVADIAMHGSDIYRAAYFEGDVMVEHIAMAKSGGKDVLDRIQDMRIRRGVRGSQVIYDSDGVGAFLGGKGGFITGAIAFHANSAPIKTDKDKGRIFAHLKDQCGFLLADDINEGKVYAEAVTDAEDQEMLSEELAAIKKWDNGDGPLRLVPKTGTGTKQGVKDLIGRSPDFSDLFLMKKAFDLIQISKPKQGLYSAFSS